MIRTLHPFRALVESLESLGRAKEPTSALLHQACAAFVAMVAEVSGERVTVWIGETPIARD